MRRSASSIRRILFLVPWLVAPPLLAQSNDHVYRSWRWEEEVGAVRAAGLAGAFVAFADDSSAASLNPAGLASLTRAEVQGGLLRRGSGSVGPGDSLASATRVGFLGAARPLGEHWAVGAFYNEPRVLHLDLAPAAMPDGLRDVGSLDAKLRDFGGAVGYDHGKLKLGLGLNAARLDMHADTSRMTRSDHYAEVLSTGGASTRLRATLGALYDLTARVRLGAALHTGATWRVDRSAYAGNGTILDPGSSYEVRAPDVYSAGATARLPLQLRVAGQLDFVRYSQIHSVLVVHDRPVTPAEYALDDAVEWRGGLEWTHPVGASMVQVRGGLYSEAPGSLTYVGPDRVEAATFTGSSRRLLGAAGASFEMSSGVLFEAGTVFGGDRTLLLMGARYRF